MRWTEQQANDWYKQHEWIMGFNYVPSTAVNSTEMWQGDTYDRETIKRELNWAAQAGYNSCRIFLQYILWENQRDIFMANFTDFCNIAESYGLSVMPILFDDCAFAGKEPYLGVQDAPRHGVHNSGWTPSPGPSIASDPTKEQSLRSYVHDVIGTFKDNKQIIVWDLYNESGNTEYKGKVLHLMGKAFEWAREIAPSQPLTACVWLYQDFDYACAELSDIVTFHDYLLPEKSAANIEVMKKYNRPMMCTEWLNRGAGNTFETHLPLYKGENIGTYHWGLVLGKTQTNLNGDTVLGEPDANPAVWQHDMFYADGTQYRAEEFALIKQCKSC